MKSKEALDFMYDNTIINSIAIDRVRECYNAIADDLEILEEIRNTFKIEKEEHETQNYYWLIVKNYTYMITKEQYDKWSGWLDNEK